MVGIVVAIALGSVDDAGYRVERAGTPVGTATIEQRILPDGGKLTLVAIAFGHKGRPDTRVRQESVYDAGGAPVRLLQEVVDRDGQVRRRSVATFDDQGAIWIVTEAGKARERRIPLVRNAPRGARSEFWFLRERPSAGARDAAFRFDLNEGRWRLIEHVYRGEESVKVGGKATRLHRVDTEAGSAWLDDAGRPIVVELGALRMERIAGPAAE